MKKASLGTTKWPEVVNMKEKIKKIRKKAELKDYGYD